MNYTIGCLIISFIITVVVYRQQASKKTTKQREVAFDSYALFLGKMRDHKNKETYYTHTDWQYIKNWIAKVGSLDDFEKMILYYLHRERSSHELLPEEKKKLENSMTLISQFCRFLKPEIKESPEFRDELKTNVERLLTLMEKSFDRLDPSLLAVLSQTVYSFGIKQIESEYRPRINRLAGIREKQATPVTSPA